MPRDLKSFDFQGVETGTFNGYDTDGTTLLRPTPKVTVLQGDIWTWSF